VVGQGYREAEARILAAIRVRFGLPAEPPPELARLVKRADRAAARLEAVRLAGFSLGEADEVFDRPEPIALDPTPFLDPWPAEQAATAFRARLLDLLG
ncbi:MAG: hydrolase, partial [Methylobacteriaceae bacterium]|nr:hydrolase [Methylobacteriaceae bacterium]